MIGTWQLWAAGSAVFAALTAIFGKIGVEKIDSNLATLIRFYTWHIFGLTLGAGILMVWHIFRVRRDGGIAVPPPALRAEKTRITRDTLVRREVLAMLLTGAALVALAAFFPAPIAAPLPQSTTAAQSIAPPVPASEPATGSVDRSADRAPWFFLWVQQMLKWGDPFVWGVLVPLVVLGVLALIPYVFPKPLDAELGRWFPKSNRLAQVVLAVIALLVLLLTILGSLPGA